MTLVLDAFRSGVQWSDPLDHNPGTSFAPELADYASVYPANKTGYRQRWNQTHVDMLMYIMHHFPGNTVKSWSAATATLSPPSGLHASQDDSELAPDRAMEKACGRGSTTRLGSRQSSSDSGSQNG